MDNKITNEVMIRIKNFQKSILNRFPEPAIYSEIPEEKREQILKILENFSDFDQSEEDKIVFVRKLLTLTREELKKQHPTPRKCDVNSIHERRIEGKLSSKESEAYGWLNTIHSDGFWDKVKAIVGEEPINIDILIKNLNNLKNEGNNYVQIHYNSGHSGYELFGLKINNDLNEKINSLPEEKRNQIIEILKNFNYNDENDKDYKKFIESLYKLLTATFTSIDEIETYKELSLIHSDKFWESVKQILREKKEISIDGISDKISKELL